MVYTAANRSGWGGFRRCGGGSLNNTRRKKGSTDNDNNETLRGGGWCTGIELHLARWPSARSNGFDRKTNKKREYYLTFFTGVPCGLSSIMVSSAESLPSVS